MNKKKILFCGEFSNLNTGYSTYTKQLLTNLHATNKYELAEFATYGTIKEIKACKSPWKIYANMPPDNSPEWKVYKQKESNQFGEWRFERVLLDFKPDIVIDIRDPWMFQHEYHSPLREFYHWMIMPPIDSYPIREDWMQMLIDADSVLLYCDWAASLLKKESNDKAKIVTVAPYGLDYNVYKPCQDKKAHRLKMGLPVDALIVGTVMRNQIRKLYPDLFESFRKFLDSASPELANKSFLYIHTSYPDNKAWEIPSLVKEFGLSKHIYCSYICRLCKKTFSSMFQDAKTRCVHCNASGAVFPNVKEGYTTEELVDVYNVFDLYVQYAICEGFGMPILEAAGCGVPITAVDFSAMIDLNNNLNGYRINVGRLYRIIESNVIRALPDNNSLVSNIKNFFEMTNGQRKEKSDQVRKLAMKNYSWSNISKHWEFAIDRASPAKRKWEDKPRLFNIEKHVPDNLNNQEFISWALSNVLHEPELEFKAYGADILRDLNYGVCVSNNKIIEIDRHKILHQLAGRAQNKLHAEQARCGLIKIDTPDYIKVANE